MTVVVQQQMQFLRENSVRFRTYHMTDEYSTHFVHSCIRAK